MQANLKILVKGFQLFEQRIIDTVIRLSAKRTPSLLLLPDYQFKTADAIIIDALDSEAMRWADSNHLNLQNQVVIWVDLDTPVNNPKHTVLNRPVLWVNLSIIVSRILEELSQAEAQEDLDNGLLPGDELFKPLASVLIVDDSQAILGYLSKILKRSGYMVTTADCGENAIKAAKIKRFDCVLMDVLMPGIDGYKACREIRRIKSSAVAMPVIMLTSRASPFDKIRGRMAGCNAYLTKPVRMDVLLKTVSKYANGLG